MAHDQLLHARFLEQLLPWVHWQRRAWQPGTLLALKELAEASQWAARGVLSNEATQYLRNDVISALSVDAGLASGAVRPHLHSILKQPLNYYSQSRRQLESLINHLEGAYIPAWRDSLASGYNVERASRFLSTHLQDAGYSHSYLRKEQSITSARSAEELIDAIDELSRRPKERFEGWVIIKTAPHTKELKCGALWKNPSDLAKVLHPAGHKVPREAIGGMKFDVDARDPVSAATEVRKGLRSLVSRTRLIRDATKFEYYPTVYFSGYSPISLAKQETPVHVMSMARANVVYRRSHDSRTSSAIDDALELASFLHGASAPAAVSNAWAAIESLLIDPEESGRDIGGRVVAADRAATVTAAAWLRAELTPLSYRLADCATLDPLVRRSLETAGEDNKGRCAVLIKYWDRVELADLKAQEDHAAVERMSQLVKSPKKVLGRVEQYMRGSFRRLYRQRNLVMHGGALRSVALDASVRTTGPLVGALLDRLSVAAYADGVEPLQSVANSRAILDMAKSQNDSTYLLDS